MWLPLGIALFALALGGAFGVLGGERTLHMAQVFAVTTVLAVVATHLLPDATEVLGWPALAAFVASLALPHAAVSAALRAAGTTAAPASRELATLGMIAHQLGDGLAVGVGAAGGAFSSSSAALVGLFAHTLPLAVMLMVIHRSEHQTRAGWHRIGALMAATTLGVLLGATVGVEPSPNATAWLSAVVAGLLVHVVLHLRPPERKPDAASRLADTVALVTGLGLAALAGAAHEVGAAHVVHSGHAHAAGHVGEGLAMRGRELLALTAPGLALGLFLQVALRLAVNTTEHERTLPTLHWWRAQLGNRMGSVASALSPPALVLSWLVLGWQSTLAWTAIAALLRSSLPATRVPPRRWLGVFEANLVWYLLGTICGAYLLEAMPPDQGPGTALALVLTLGLVQLAGVPTIAVLAALPALVSLPGWVLGAMVGASTVQLRGVKTSHSATLALPGAILGALLIKPPALGEATVLPLADATVVLLAALAIWSLWRQGLLAWVDALTPPSQHGSAAQTSASASPEQG